MMTVMKNEATFANDARSSRWYWFSDGISAFA